MRRPPLLLLHQVDELLMLSYKNSSQQVTDHFVEMHEMIIT